MAMTSEIIEQHLGDRGYSLVRRGECHSLYENGTDRLVVPHHARPLPPWTVRTIEWELAPRLGPRWLDDPAVDGAADGGPADGAAAPSGPEPRVVLQLVVRRDPAEGVWNAFVLEVPRILTFGDTLDDVRRRAADAAYAWFGSSAAVVFDLVLQPGPEAQRWIDHARGRGGAAATEALAGLRQLGFDDADGRALLAEAQPESG